MTITTLIAAVVAVFAIFAAGVGYAQYQVRGMAAPGSLPIQ